jgi:hypothetical protein
MLTLQVILAWKKGLSMTVYDDFRDAWVDHVVFKNRAAQLATARSRMDKDPNYDPRKYREAVFKAERIAAASERVMCRGFRHAGS